MTIKPCVIDVFLQAVVTRFDRCFQDLKSISSWLRFKSNPTCWGVKIFSFVMKRQRIQASSFSFLAFSHILSHRTRWTSPSSLSFDEIGCNFFARLQSINLSRGLIRQNEWEHLCVCRNQFKPALDPKFRCILSFNRRAEVEIYVLLEVNVS